MSKMRFLHLLFIACAISCASAPQKTTLVWTEGEKDPESDRATHTLEIQNPPAGLDWTIWFSQFRTPVKMEDGAPGEIAHVSGTLYRIIPKADTCKGTMTLRYAARPLVNQCRAPEGFFLQDRSGEKTPLEIKYVFLPAEEKHSFEYTPKEISAYDMIPALKEVSLSGGSFNPATIKETEPVFIEGKVHGWYRISIGEEIKIEAADADGAWYAKVTLDNIRRNAAGKELPCAVITDWPDLPYRGMMLDVSRNFTTKENLLKYIDILAHYKVNYLHLHFGDDEGWRIEIDALPELTSYGAFRTIPVLNDDGSISEPDALQPTYCVSAAKDDLESSGNGYYSHADFVEILRHAADAHIKVIPEFDTPGHSRAAIKSMEIRAQRTGDTSCLLSEPADSSEYVSVQDYTDNAINVALPSTYTFIETVFDGLIALYKEAGVPLEAIHVGGDEVPQGSWLGSPACQELMRRSGKTNPEWLKDYFISHVLDIAKAKGVKIAGWQEVAQHLEPETFRKLKENLFMVNFWAVSRGRDMLAYQFANDGIPVVLSNSSNNYFDMAYNDSKLERGHSWASFVDERRSFSFLPYNFYRSVRWDDHGNMTRLQDADKGKTPLTQKGLPYILGVQGQLWTETIRNFGHVTYYTFPKALGLFDRGWNARPVWSETTAPDDPLFMEDFDRFFSVVHDFEYPYYDSLGISYHIN